MSKFLVIILLVSVGFHLNHGREFDINGAEKSSEDDVLRGAHFKVRGFQVNIKKYNSYNYSTIQLEIWSVHIICSIHPLCTP